MMSMMSDLGFFEEKDEGGNRRYSKNTVFGDIESNLIPKYNDWLLFIEFK